MFAYLLIILITSTTTGIVWAQFDNTTCGISKGCMLSPGCNPSRNCNKAFSWKVAGNYLQMELAGLSSGGAINYIAVGFSNTQTMGGQGVTDCTFGGSAGPATHLSYNNGHSNARITDYPYLSNHLQLLNSSTINGRLYCAVNQLIVPQHNNSDIPWLNSTHFFILMAVGTATDQGLNMHDIIPIDSAYPYVSSYTVNLTAPIGSSSVNGSLSSTSSTMTMTTTSPDRSSSLHGFGLLHGTLFLCVLSIIFCGRE